MRPIVQQGAWLANNAGLVTTAGGGVSDLVHTIGTGHVARLVKIMWSNRTGVDGTLIFGDLDGTPAWVPFLPTITCLTGFDGEYDEEEIPDVPWQLVRLATGAAVTTQRTGNVRVLGSVAGILVRCTIEER